MASISRNVALYMQYMILNIYAEKPKPLPWHFPLHFPAGVCSLFGNSTLLYVSYKKKRHLKPAEYFIINLAVSDLGLTLSLYPMAISSSFYHRFTLIGWQYDYLSVMLTLLLSLFFSHSPSSASISLSLFLSFSLSLFLSLLLPPTQVVVWENRMLCLRFLWNAVWYLQSDHSHPAERGVLCESMLPTLW